MRLPAAGPEPHPSSKPSAKHKRDARHALAAGAGSAIIILSGARERLNAPGRAAKVARAFNGAMQRAEEMHKRYWKEYDDNA